MSAGSKKSSILNNIFGSPDNDPDWDLFWDGFFGGRFDLDKLAFSAIRKMLKVWESNIDGFKQDWSKEYWPVARVILRAIVLVVFKSLFLIAATLLSVSFILLRPLFEFSFKILQVFKSSVRLLVEGFFGGLEKFLSPAKFLRLFVRATLAPKISFKFAKHEDKIKQNPNKGWFYNRRYRFASFFASILGKALLMAVAAPYVAAELGGSGGAVQVAVGAIQSGVKSGYLGHVIFGFLAPLGLSSVAMVVGRAYKGLKNLGNKFYDWITKKYYPEYKSQSDLIAEKQEIMNHTGPCWKDSNETEYSRATDQSLIDVQWRAVPSLPVCSDSLSLSGSLDSYEELYYIERPQADFVSIDTRDRASSFTSSGGLKLLDNTSSSVEAPESQKSQKKSNR